MPDYIRGPTRGAVLLIALSFILVVVLGIGYTTWSIHQSQRQWCDTLSLLTAHPVPKPSDPKANPSRETAYVYYRDFVTLKDRLGC